MFALPQTLRILLGIVAAIAGIIAGLIGQAIWQNVVYAIAKRGPKPHPRPLRLWIAFAISVLITVVCGTLSVAASSSETPRELKYLEGLVATALAIRTEQASIAEQPGPGIDATQTAYTVQLTSLQGTIEALEKTATNIAAVTISSTPTTATMTSTPSMIPSASSVFPRPTGIPVRTPAAPTKIPPSSTALPPTQRPSPTATSTLELSFSIWDTQVTCAYIQNRVYNPYPSVTVRVTGFISARSDDGIETTISEVPPPYQDCPSCAWCGPHEDIHNHFTNFHGVVWGTTWVHYQGKEVDRESFGPTPLTCNP